MNRIGKFNNKLNGKLAIQSPEHLPVQRILIIDQSGNEHSIQESLRHQGQKELSLLDVILDNQIEISNGCGGMGTCGTCRVFIKEIVGDLPPVQEPESEMATARGFSKGPKGHERLSCQVGLPCESFEWTVLIPEDSL